jgi:serine/threonine-protein kinase
MKLEHLAPTAPPPPDLPSGILRNEACDAVGLMLPGGLRVVRPIGRGAVGVVLEAVEESGRRVAVKMLSPESSLEIDLWVRLEREARAVSRLTSPHVARLFDVRELDDGTPFLVMEYLEGLPLDEVLARSGPLSAERAVQVALEVLDPLAEAHTLGLVHRDVKPSNIFVTYPEPGVPFVKLLDFGLVNDVATLPGSLRLTRSGFMLGTPAYMAPEQLQGRASAHPTADVWAVGATLYELLTGRLPFDGPSLPVIAARILREAPSSIRTLRPDVSRELEEIVMRCLDKNPENRFRSAGALAIALTS